MENNDIIKIARAKAEKWLDKAYDEKTRAEAKRMLENTDTTELVESFYNDLEFGTGGLRGIMGVGTNRMNIYTVGAATQGFSNYINKMFPNEKKAVCIGHDCRNNSRLFSETAANIFSANDIHVYLFEDLRPTPEMSFAIRELGCKGGVILTASHNPTDRKTYCCTYGLPGSTGSEDPDHRHGWNFLCRRCHRVPPCRSQCSVCGNCELP